MIINKMPLRHGTVDKNDRKEGAMKSKLTNQPESLPTCYVCHRVISELVELKKLRDAKLASVAIIQQQKRVIERVVSAGYNEDGSQRLRHSGFCEPGANNYMKDPDLRRDYNQHFIMKGARRRIAPARRKVRV